MENNCIVNSLICFLNSAKKDQPNDIVLDIAQSFYSHDEIKKAKELICIVLKKDIIWRRDKEKKKKDLHDVLEYIEEIDQREVKLVTDSHKCMPPIGFEKLGGMLTHLAEQVSNINELLPKIMDIKTEVQNTADAVRDIKIDMCNLKNKFSNAINGLEEATKDVSIAESTALDDMESLRYSQARRPSISLNDFTSEEIGKSYAVALMDGRQDLGESELNTTGEHRQSQKSRPIVGADNQASVVKNGIMAPSRMMAGTGHRQGERRDVGGGASDEVLLDNPAQPLTDTFNGTGAIRKQPLHLPRRAPQASDRPLMANRRGQVAVEDGWMLQLGGRSGGRNDNDKKVRTTGVKGSGRNAGGTLRAASRSVDVFIGRVSSDVDCDGINDYIKEIFGVQTLSINEIGIRATDYKAFKVGVKLTDRDKLFDADLWPEDIIVDKFYNKSRRNYEGGKKQSV